jgi:8-oxo-dGTP diphosphatase
MTVVRFYDASFSDGGRLVYSVIAARFKGQWIFVRHHERTTWEISGGHIEKGESPDDAARRELSEETGAKDFDLTVIGMYSVEKNGKTGFGMLYLADVHSLMPVPDTSEIAEIMFADDLPPNLTYPDIQPHMFRKILQFLNERD